jgi:ribosomal protein L10
MSAVIPTNQEIADLLRSYARAKTSVRYLRVTLMRIAVEQLGMDQQEAKDINIEVFFDGYLVGKGVMQSWRKIA